MAGYPCKLPGQILFITALSAHWDSGRVGTGGCQLTMAVFFQYSFQLGQNMSVHRKSASWVFPKWVKRNELRLGTLGTRGGSGFREVGPKQKTQERERKKSKSQCLQWSVCTPETKNCVLKTAGYAVAHSIAGHCQPTLFNFINEITLFRIKRISDKGDLSRLWELFLLFTSSVRSQPPGPTLVSGVLEHFQDTQKAIFWQATLF